MTLVTPTVAEDVAKIIRDHHSAVAAILFGRDAVSEDAWKMAVGLGLIADDSPGLIEDLSGYGALLAQMEEQDHSMTLDQFRELREHAEEAKQTPIELRAAKFVRTHGASLIVGLGNKVGATVGSRLVEADKQLDHELRSTIRDIVSARFGDREAAERVRNLGVAKGFPSGFFDGQFRATVRRIVSDIGHATNDWARDLQRIAQTETHNAVNQGMSEAWNEDEEETARQAGRAPLPIMVFRLPRPEACRHCVRLYLESGVPRIFYLHLLQANGTNQGRRAPDWRPVVGATHPWCGCSLHRVPAVLDMPTGWVSGDSAPTVIGPGGRIVIPEE